MIYLDLALGKSLHPFGFGLGLSARIDELLIHNLKFKRWIEILYELSIRMITHTKVQG